MCESDYSESKTVPEHLNDNVYVLCTCQQRAASHSYSKHCASVWLFYCLCVCAWVCVWVCVICWWHTCHFKALDRCESLGTSDTETHSGKHSHVIIIHAERHNGCSSLQYCKSCTGLMSSPAVTLWWSEIWQKNYFQISLCFKCSWLWTKTDLAWISRCSTFMWSTWKYTWLTHSHTPVISFDWRWELQR